MPNYPVLTIYMENMKRAIKEKDEYKYLKYLAKACEYCKQEREKRDVKV